MMDAEQVLAQHAAAGTAAATALSGSRPFNLQPEGCTCSANRNEPLSQCVG